MSDLDLTSEILQLEYQVMNVMEYISYFNDFDTIQSISYFPTRNHHTNPFKKKYTITPSYYKNFININTNGMGSISMFELINNRYPRKSGMQSISSMDSTDSPAICIFNKLETKTIANLIFDLRNDMFVRHDDFWKNDELFDIKENNYGN